MGNSFPVAPMPEKGYNRQEVDDFIEKARSSYQGLSREVTVETVTEICFDEEVGGYDFDAVDTALDRLEVGFKEKFGDPKDRQTTEEVEPLGITPDAKTQAKAAADFEDLRTGSVRIIDGDAITKATKDKEEQESLVEPKTEVFDKADIKAEPKTEIIEEAPTNLLTNPLKLFRRKSKKEQKETVVAPTTAATSIVEEPKTVKVSTIDEPKTEVFDKADIKVKPRVEVTALKSNDSYDKKTASKEAAIAEKVNIDKRTTDAKKLSIVEEYGLPELPETEATEVDIDSEVSVDTDPNINMNRYTKPKVSVNPDSKAIAKIEVIDTAEKAKAGVLDSAGVKSEVSALSNEKSKKKKKAKAIKATLANAGTEDKKTGIDKDTALNHIVENVQKRRGSIPGEPEPFKEELGNDNHTTVAEDTRKAKKKLKKKAVVADLNRGASVKAEPLAKAGTLEQHNSGKTAAGAELATTAVGEKALNKVDSQPKGAHEVILARFNRGSGKRFNKATQTGYKVAEVDKFVKSIAYSMQNGEKLSVKDIKKAKFSSARSLDAYSEKQVDAVLSKLIEVIKAN
ncbi:MAG: hypothetical protein QM613_00440 [Micrococcaceae bacterium]